MTIGCGFMTTLLCALGKIDGAVYATVIISTVGVFIGGSTVEKVKARKQQEPA